MSCFWQMIGFAVGFAIGPLLIIWYEEFERSVLEPLKWRRIKRKLRKRRASGEILKPWDAWLIEEDL